jgi:hypothetical protein
MATAYLALRQAPASSPHHDPDPSRRTEAADEAPSRSPPQPKPSSSGLHADDPWAKKKKRDLPPLESEDIW